MSTIEAVLLVVIEIKDSSPTGPLVPGHVREVSVVMSSAHSKVWYCHNPLKEM